MTEHRDHDPDAAQAAVLEVLRAGGRGLTVAELVEHVTQPPLILDHRQYLRVAASPLPGTRSPGWYRRVADQLDDASRTDERPADRLMRCKVALLRRVLAKRVVRQHAGRRSGEARRESSAAKWTRLVVAADQVRQEHPQWPDGRVHAEAARRVGIPPSTATWLRRKHGNTSPMPTRQ